MAEVWVTAVVVGGSALLSAGAGIYSSNKASKAQQGASGDAIAENRRQFDLVRSDTAGQRFIGNAAIDRLARLYGYGSPFATTAGRGVPAGATALAPTSGNYQPGEFGDTAAGRALGYDFAKPMLNPAGATAQAMGFGTNTTIGKVLDPVGFGLSSLFGSKKGDEKRNLKAFTSENKIYDLGNDMLALEDGTIFPKSKLEEVAGTWYGAKYAPDGDQTGWQQKYDDLIGGLRAATGGGQTGATAQGYRPTPGGGVEPIMQAGNAPVTIDNATGQVMPSGPMGMDVFFESPDFRFNLAEGQKAIDRSAAARGGLLSGRAVREGTRYASGQASREFSGFVDRLMQQAGLGSTGIAASANAGANATGNITQAIMNAGNARASGYLNTGQAINNAGQGAASNYLLYRYLAPGG